MSVSRHSSFNVLIIYQTWGILFSLWSLHSFHGNTNIIIVKLINFPPSANWLVASWSYGCLATTQIRPPPSVPFYSHSVIRLWHHKGKRNQKKKKYRNTWRAFQRRRFKAKICLTQRKKKECLRKYKRLEMITLLLGLTGMLCLM